jgi:hypothetical protein
MESTESNQSEWSEVFVSLEHCRALLVYRTRETFLTSWRIINTVRNLWRVINYCHNLRLQKAIRNISSLKNYNHDFVILLLILLLLLLLHLLVLRISPTMLLLAKILEGFTNNIQFNDPKFLGTSYFFSRSAIGCNFSSIIHSPAFNYLHIN